MTVKRPAPPDFDRIARAYRWMEYLSLGAMLERTRWHHLEQGRLAQSREALVLGDGDGRFTQRLLEGHREVRVTAVDLSGAMLGLLSLRCRQNTARLALHLADAREFIPVSRPDLVVTHFFLDCLAQEEVAGLIQRLKPKLAPDCLWLVSEFRIPGGVLRRPVQLWVMALYLAFRILTGLRVSHLPDHAGALRACGFTMVAEQRFMAGILTTQLWRNG